MKRLTLYLALTLFVVSGITRFLFFGIPNSIIFDEVYFARYASDYITKTYYFDPHPPLGKLIIWGVGKMGGVTSDPTDYSKIGNSFEDPVKFWYRLVPAFAGTLLPVVIFLLVFSLGMSRIMAFVAGALVILENSLLVQARFVSLDGLLLLFGFTSLLLYVLYRKSEGGKRKALLLATALLSCAAISIKWTGFAYPLVMFVMELLENFDRKAFLKSTLRLGKFVGVFAGVTLVFYTLQFVPHFALLTKSGQGNAFMTPRFQKTLEDSTYAADPTLLPKGFFGKTIELNMEMLAVNKRMSATHSYSSKWYTWPFMERGVFYWQGVHDGEGNRYLYFLGNPFIYWLGAVSIAFLVWLIIRKRGTYIVNLIVAGFLANFLPYILIGRVMFLYHYQAALVFAIIALAYILERHLPSHKKLAGVSALLILCTLSFIFFSPLTYGTYLKDAELKARMWLPTWR